MDSARLVALTFGQAQSAACVSAKGLGTRGGGVRGKLLYRFLRTPIVQPSSCETFSYMLPTAAAEDALHSGIIHGYIPQIAFILAVPQHAAQSLSALGICWSYTELLCSLGSNAPIIVTVTPKL